MDEERVPTLELPWISAHGARCFIVWVVGASVRGRHPLRSSVAAERPFLQFLATRNKQHRQGTVGVLSHRRSMARVVAVVGQILETLGGRWDGLVFQILQEADVNIRCQAFNRE